MYNFNPYCIPSLIAACVALVSLCISLKKKRAGSRAVVLSFLFVQLFCCMVCEALLINAATPGLTLFWDRTMYISIILIPATLVHIAMHYLPGQKSKLFIYIPAIVFLSIAYTDLLLAGVEKTFWGWGKVVGPAYFAFQVYFGSYAICFCGILSRAICISKSDRRKNELLCLVVGMVPTVMVGSSIITIFPLLGIKAANIMVNAICVTGGATTLTYSMLTNRMFDLYAVLPIIGAERQKRKMRLKQAITSLLDEKTPFTSYEELVAKAKDIFNVDVHIETVTGDYKQTNLIADQKFRPKYKDKYDISHCGADMVLPVYAGQKLLAVVRFGPEISDQIYSTDDLLMLSCFCGQLKLAISYLQHFKLSLNNYKFERATVSIYKAEGEIYTVRKTGNVSVAVIDYDHKNISIKH